MKVINDTLSVAWKEIQLIAKDRGSLALLILLPLLIGSLTGGINVQLNPPGGTPDILLRVAVVDQDVGTPEAPVLFGQQVLQALEGIDELEVETVTSADEAERQVTAGEVKAAIIIPPGFTEMIYAHTPTEVEVIVDPAEPESASIVSGIVNQVVSEVTIWGEVKHGVYSLLEAYGPFAEAPAEVKQAIGMQTLGVIMTQLNELRQNPAIVVSSEDLTGAQIQGGIILFLAYMFPGFTVMFAFFVVGTSASALLSEREAGTLRRLLAAPISRGAIIAGKMLAYTLLICLQVAILFTVAHLLFGMPLGQSPAAVVLLTLVLALTAAALGMLVAALAKTAQQAGNIGMLIGFVLAGIGGALPLGATPISRAGGFIGILTKLTPHAHAVEAYYSVMAEKATLVQVLPQIGILLAFGVVFFLIAVWRLEFK